MRGFRDVDLSKTGPETAVGFWSMFTATLLVLEGLAHKKDEAVETFRRYLQRNILTVPSAAARPKVVQARHHRPADSGMQWGRKDRREEGTRGGEHDGTSDRLGGINPLISRETGGTEGARVFRCADFGWYGEAMDALRHPCSLCWDGRGKMKLAKDVKLKWGN